MSSQRQLPVTGLTAENDIDPIRSELADLLAEHLVWHGTARQRAAALHQLISCAVDAVRWRLEPYGDPAEEMSLAAVVAAVSDHYRRMTDSSES